MARMWSLLNENDAMISNYLPLPAENDAPPIVRELRMAFDARLTNLYQTALTMHAADPGSPTKMFHVPFSYGSLSVEAMYDAHQDLFTQVVARPISAKSADRPAYTISMFLVAGDPYPRSEL